MPLHLDDPSGEPLGGGHVWLRDLMPRARVSLKPGRCRGLGVKVDGLVFGV